MKRPILKKERGIKNTVKYETLCDFIKFKFEQKCWWLFTVAKVGVWNNTRQQPSPTHTIYLLSNLMVGVCLLCHVLCIFLTNTYWILLLLGFICNISLIGVVLYNCFCLQMTHLPNGSRKWLKHRNCAIIFKKVFIKYVFLEKIVFSDQFKSILNLWVSTTYYIMRQRYVLMCKIWINCKIISLCTNQWFEITNLDQV